MRNSKYLDSEIAAIREAVHLRALANGGVFRRRDLSAWGFEPELAPLLMRRGTWRRMLHGIYVDAAYQETLCSTIRGRHQLDCAAAVVALSEPAYVASLSAALLHDLPISDRLSPREVHLLRPPGGEVRRRMRKGSDRFPVHGVKIIRHELDKRDRGSLDGIPVTSKLLAAFIAAAAHELERAVALLDCVSFQSPSSLERLETLLVDWSSMTGIGRLRNAVQLTRTGAQSPLESISRVRLTQLGVPEPELQFELRDSRGLIGYADMYWNDIAVVGEADGLEKYQSRSDLVAEKFREDRIRALGLRVVRWTWDDIVKSPREVARRIMSSQEVTTRKQRWRNSA